MHNQSTYPPPYPAGFQLGPAPNPLGYPPPGGYPPLPQGHPPAVGYAPPVSQQPVGFAPPVSQQPVGYAPPVSQQPMSGGQVAESGWMSSPAGPPPNCPPCLAYLTTIYQLLVHQKVEPAEALDEFDTNNKFTVKNSLGQKVFYAVEQSDCCSRSCNGSVRSFGMKIMDSSKNEVIHMERPLACDLCCFPCCLQKLEVYSPHGCLVGTVEKEWSILFPSFSIKNDSGYTILHIKGPFCINTCCDVEFKVLSSDGSSVVGRISKQYRGMLRETSKDYDYIGATFPMDLDVRMKAVMLGACFLIDAMYFGDSRRTRRPEVL